MSESNYKPSGELQGDDKNIPDAGTRRGFVNYGEPYGADTSPHATNRLGGFHGSCTSDPIDSCHADVQRVTGNGSRPFSGQGKRMTGTDSDPVNDDRADDQRF